MFNRFKHLFRKRIKSSLPNPNYEYRIVFKKGAVEAIKKAKGWRSDAELARNLGLTRAYISMLHRTRATVSATVITRIAACLGNVERNWWIFFEIVPYGVAEPNHPHWNMEKHAGRVPYDRFSLSAEVRKRDYLVETVKGYKRD